MFDPVPRVGGIRSGARAPYACLSATIPRFHSAPQLADIMRAAGFSQVHFTYESFGLVAIREATR